MTTDLRHYSGKPLDLSAWKSVTQEPDTKPKGLWVSVGDEWRQWCLGEEYGLNTLTHEHRITLAAGANLLHLSNGHQLSEFTAQYGVPAPYGIARHKYIDWPRIASQYSGILISPYQWAARRDHFWYYGWDVASGCIWDRAAIAEISEAVAS